MNTVVADADLLGNVRAAMRPDLMVSRQRHGGRTTFVVKEPVGLRYVHLREEEYFLLSSLDGRRSLEEFQHRYAQHFAPKRIPLAEIDNFVKQCLLNGVATVGTPKVGLRLHERAVEKRWARVRQTLLNPLSFKIRLFDPDRLLNVAEPFVSWIFSRTAAVLAAAFLLATVLFALIRWSQIEARIPNFQEFFGSYNLVLLWLTIGAVKIAHEFGHAFACKRYGGEVHEMGFMLLVLSPALYCNVSDAWTFPRLSRRLAVGAAGIYVEVLLAAAAFWVWWSTAPGLVNFLALGVVAICTINTVLFNGNPLLKFDGYYLLSDAVGIPNLRKRADQYFGNLVARWVFGREVLPDPLKPTRRRWAFAFFALASYVYRWIVALGIVLFLYALLKPYKLEVLSQILAWYAVFSMAVVPSIRLFVLVRKRWPAMKVVRKRAWIGAAAAASIATVALLAPLPHRLDVACICRFAGEVAVVAPSPGIVRRIHVVDGDVVEPGQVLAELDSPSLARRMRTLEIEIETDEARLRAGEAFDDLAAVEAARRSLQGKREQIRLLTEERRRLNIVVPPHVSGVVVRPLREEDLGRPLKAGEEFCRIGGPGKLDVYAVVESTDAAFVNVGQAAWISIRGRTGPPVASTVLDVARTKLDEVPESLSNRIRGGPIASAAKPESTETRASATSIRPILTSYALTLSVPPGKEIAPGVRGTVRLLLEPASLGARVLRWIDQTLLFRL